MTAESSLSQNPHFYHEAKQASGGPVAITDMLSVVVPVLIDEQDPAATLQAYIDCLRGQAARVEFIFVLDSQAHRTHEALRELKDAGEDITIVVLSRSEDEAAALRCGFQRTSGATILTLPALEQFDPSELPKLLEALTDHDMALARRVTVKLSRFGAFQESVFHGMTRLLFGRPFNDLNCRVRAYRRQVVEEIASYNSQQQFLPLLAAERGFRITEVDVGDKAASSDQPVVRTGVKPIKRLRLLLDTLVLYVVLNFMRKPMRFFGAIGFPIFAIGLGFTAMLGIDRLIFDTALANRPALILGVLFLVLGIQIVALGLMGEIINFASGKKNKDYTIDKII